MEQLSMASLLNESYENTNWEGGPHSIQSNSQDSSSFSVSCYNTSDVSTASVTDLQQTAIHYVNENSLEMNYGSWSDNNPYNYMNANMYYDTVQHDAPKKAKKPTKPRPKPKCPIKRQNQRSAANVRERTRMKTINEAFQDLKERIPLACKDRKVSKVDTLRLAINYIHHLHNTVAYMDNSAPSVFSPVAMAGNYEMTSQPAHQPLPFVQGMSNSTGEMNYW